MSDVTQNPSFHFSKPPHKLSNKHVVLKNKPTKKSSTRSRNKNNISNNNNHRMMLNNNNNNRPLKVVHISNPMKFQVAAAGFRALVQGLTGRDAVVEWPIDHDESQVVATNDDSTDGGNNSTDDQSNEVNGSQLDDHQEDEVINNNFSACFGPSDHHLMSFDYFGNHFNVEDVELYGCYEGSFSFYG